MSKNTIWTKEMEAELIRYAALRMDCKEIAERMGRTHESIAQKAHRLKLRLKKCPPPPSQQRGYVAVRAFLTPRSMPKDARFEDVSCETLERERRRSPGVKVYRRVAMTNHGSLVGNSSAMCAA